MKKTNRLPILIAVVGCLLGLSAFAETEIGVNIPKSSYVGLINMYEKRGFQIDSLNQTNFSLTDAKGILDRNRIMVRLRIVNEEHAELTVKDFSTVNPHQEVIRAAKLRRISAVDEYECVFSSMKTALDVLADPSVVFAMTEEDCQTIEESHNHESPISFLNRKMEEGFEEWRFKDVFPSWLGGSEDVEDQQQEQEVRSDEEDPGLLCNFFSIWCPESAAETASANVESYDGNLNLDDLDAAIDAEMDNLGQAEKVKTAFSPEDFILHSVSKKHRYRIHVIYRGTKLKLELDRKKKKKGGFEIYKFGADLDVTKVQDPELLNQIAEDFNRDLESSTAGADY